jgi:putative flippase GtrA
VRAIGRKAEQPKTMARSAVAGLAATGADLATLSFLVLVAHWSPRAANVPALLWHRVFRVPRPGSEREHVEG